MANVNVEAEICTPVSPELIKNKQNELRRLRGQWQAEKQLRMKQKEEARAERDAEVEALKATVQNILDHCYRWRKLGKKAKLDYDIIGKIRGELSPIETK